MGKAVEQELMGLENKFWEAMKSDDYDTMTDLTDETCILASAQGVSKFRREDFRKMSEQSNYKLHEFDIKDWQISVLSPDTAVVAYKVDEKLTVEGKPVSLNAAESSTWIRKNGQWVCCLHTESISGDPFGRDKVAEH